MTNDARIVVIESPLRGKVPTWAPRWLAPWIERYGRWQNKRYARACMRDSLLRGECPYASHLLFDQRGVLNDADPAQREQGMQAGFTWGEAAGVRIVYEDRGITAGMLLGIEHGARLGQRIVYRRLVRA